MRILNLIDPSRGFHFSFRSCWEIKLTILNELTLLFYVQKIGLRHRYVERAGCGKKLLVQRDVLEMLLGTTGGNASYRNEYTKETLSLEKGER